MMPLRVHVDQPRGMFLQNLSQTFSGWAAVESGKEAHDLEFSVDGEPVQPFFHPRPDARQALDGFSVAGWSFNLDQACLTGRRQRTLEFVVRHRDSGLIYRRSFLVSRMLMRSDLQSPLFFMHIPKTAGTSLRHFVEYAFAEMPVLAIYDEYPGIYESQALGELLPLTRGREIFFGHFAYDFVRKVRHDGAKVVAVFREPADIVNSYLRFMKNPDARFLDNPLVRYVSGIAYDSPPGAIGEKSLDAALAIARRNFFVISSSGLQEFADRFCSTFSIPRFEVPTANKTPDDRVRQRMAWNTRYDDVLYRECLASTPDFVDFLNR